MSSESLEKEHFASFAVSWNCREACLAARTTAMLTDAIRNAEAPPNFMPKTYCNITTKAPQRVVWIARKGRFCKLRGGLNLLRSTSSCSSRQSSSPSSGRRSRSFWNPRKMMRFFCSCSSSRNSSRRRRCCCCCCCCCCCSWCLVELETGNSYSIARSPLLWAGVGWYI